MSNEETPYYTRFKPENLRRVLCRPALPRDTEDVMELTRTIWDGNDYVPHLWAQWLADPDGLLAAAEYGPHVVGLGKLTRIEDGEWWLEGLRVHPAYEGRRIASHLTDYLFAHWATHHGGTVRLATGSHRVQVQHLCDRNGLTRIAEFTPFTAPPLEAFEPKELVDTFQELKESEIAEALDFTRGNPAFELVSGLMDLGWQWTRPSASLLMEAVTRDHAWWWKGKTGLLILAEDREEPQTPLPVIELLACPLDRILDCLLDYRRLVATLGFSKAGWVAPLQPEVLEILQGAGFQRDWELSIYIYEKSLARPMV
jgi:ribosomal protein S18 acetylase RimI-like enzyme